LNSRPLCQLPLRPPTDFHPDELYKAHTSIETSCHRGSGPAGVYGAETTDCDSPFSLVNATFDWIADNLKDSVDFVIWTGDSARHDGDEDNPRTPDSVLYTNRMMSDKFVETFSNKNGRLSIPVIPTFGNNDFLPHNIMDPGPNRWLSAYSDVWRRFIPEEQRHSFEFGGWFYVEAIPNRLAVFSLNTMFFFDRNAAVDGCAAPSEPGFKHMDWLRVQLELLRERGVKAILMGHVPPARTAGKQNWDETCWQRYTLWLQQYRDVVITGLYGHMNIDHFLLGDTREITIDAAEEEEDVSGAEVMREAMGGDDDFSVASKSDYLVELRDQWSGLPGTAGRISTLAEDEDEGVSEEDEDEAEEYTVAGKKKKGKKGKRKRKGFKKIGGKYAERYQLSFISPSIVPNYLPTLRIFEYNITGLEDSPTWKDGYSGALSNSQQFAENDYETETDRQELKRGVNSDDDDDDDQVHEAGKKKKEGKRGRKGDKKKKKKKKKHHNDPNLVIPKPPPKHAAPGPAYLPQPLSLVSYTQYLLNLTFINNEGDNDDVPDAAQGGKKKKEEKEKKKPPKHKDGKLRIFDFEVEYDTKNDERYKLPDLTVRSMVKLAYRMGKGAAGSAAGSAATVSDEADLNEVEATGNKKKKKKGKKGKKKTTNKTWLAFVRRAFVGTVDDDELEKM
jgi:endopolyphosphatase